MAREVREGRLDLAFVALPGDGLSGLELIPLAREPIMLAVPAEHRLAIRALLPPSLVDTTEDIAFVPIRDHPPEFQTAIAIPANRLLTAATRAMLETIKRHTSET